MIFASCETEATALGLPLYAFARKLPSGSTNEQLIDAVNEYLRGLDESARSAGYGTVLGKGAEEYVRSVTLTDAAAVVDFSDQLRTSGGFGTSAYNSRLIAEMGATILQFADVESVQFLIGGSCEAFWDVVWGVPECRPPVTRSPEPGEVGSNPEK